MTDHRIGLTQHNLPAIMDGSLEDLIEALRAYDQAEQLKAQAERLRPRVRRAAPSSGFSSGSPAANAAPRSPRATTTCARTTRLRCRPRCPPGAGAG